MMAKLILLIFFSLVLAAPLVLAQDCSSGTQENQYWNTDCTNKSQPYCANLNSGQKCSQCYFPKTDYPMCDCINNQFCTQDQQSGNINTCVNFPSAGIKCSSPTDCPQLAFIGTSTQTVGYWSCVNGMCAPCNNTYYSQPITCPGGSPYPGTSHGGYVVSCNSTGYWQTLSVGSTTTTTTGATNSGGTTTTTTSSSSSSSSSPTTTSASIEIAPLLLAILFALAILSPLIR